jgi:hypothetical protein
VTSLYLQCESPRTGSVRILYVGAVMGKNGHVGVRDTISGQFVKKGTEIRRPSTTVREIIPNPGHGDTGRSKGNKK